MKTEFEIVFPRIDHDVFREKIVAEGGKCTQEKTLMRRVIFENPLKKKASFVRVRDEGDKITTTFKDVSEGEMDINSVRERELEISDFEAMVDIYTSVGLKKKAYQTTYRETWRINDEVDVMMDIWPGLEPFVEIEAESEDIVRKYVDVFGFNYKDGIFGCVDELYLEELGIEKDLINNMEEITFDNIPKK